MTLKKEQIQFLNKLTKKVRLIVDSKKLSLESISIESGINKLTLQRIFNGNPTHMPRRRTIIDLSYALGISLIELFGKEEATKIKGKKVLIDIAHLSHSNQRLVINLVGNLAKVELV